MSEKLSITDEIARTVGLPKELILKATEFMGVLLKEPLNELSAIIVDDIRYLRVKNQVNLLLKTREYFEKKHLNPQNVPVKVIVPLLEASSLEEDTSLQAKWKSLLVNASYPTSERHVISAYIDILKQLSPKEVQLLDHIFDSRHRNPISFGFLAQQYIDVANVTRKELMLYFDNFVRLNLIHNVLTNAILDELNNQEHESSMFANNNDPYFSMQSSTRFWKLNTDEYELTELGADFIASCRDPE